MANSIKKVRFYLPTDLIYDTLLWLPVKTLLRFKSVCKAWSALIENPYFVEKYQKLQSVRELDPSFNIILATTSSPDYAIKLLYCNDASHKLIETHTSFFSDMKLKLESSTLFGMDFCVVGIDNGLVCLCSYIYREKIIIFNPITKQLRRIRLFELSKRYKYDIVFQGFGSLVNDYELIRIVCSFVDKNSPVLRAELYTKGINTWKDIEVKLEVSYWLGRLNYNGINYSEAVLINGVFYWKPICDGHHFVPYFDIQKGVFDLIETPLETHTAWGYQLYGLKDKLALIAFKHSSESLWILNENLTWTEVNIDFGVIPDYISIFESKITVFGSTRNDELLLERRHGGNLKLILYDINSQEIKVLHDVNFKGCIHNLYLYTPALTPVS